MTYQMRVHPENDMLLEEAASPAAGGNNQKLGNQSEEDLTAHVAMPHVQSYTSTYRGFVFRNDSDQDLPNLLGMQSMIGLVGALILGVSIVSPRQLYLLPGPGATQFICHPIQSPAAPRTQSSAAPHYLNIPLMHHVGDMYDSTKSQTQNIPDLEVRATCQCIVTYVGGCIIFHLF